MEKQNGSVLLEIQGLCCKEEQSLLEKKIGSLHGIIDLDVNVITRRLRVNYDPGSVAVPDIIKSVAETGMKAMPTDTAYSRKTEWWRERRVALLAVSALLTAAAFLGREFAMPRWTELALFISAIAIGGFYTARAGLSAARTMSMNINTLLILGVVGAVGLDLWGEAAVLVLVYSLGNVLESFVVGKARGAIKTFVDLTPNEALILRGNTEVIVPAADLQIGDRVRVRPGEKIPIDGLVLDGESFVDESMITGEPAARRKVAGRPVFAGTLNQKGSLVVEVTKKATDTTLAKIIHSVEDAQSKKSSYQNFGERFGRIYTPAMFFLGIGVATIPPLLLGASWESWIYRGLVVFVVSCSCGLALSVPVAVVAAVGNAARHGILFKGGVSLEKTAAVRATAFDKTGTLTVGRPTVTRILPQRDVTEEKILTIAASLEAHSEHPLGAAIVRRANELGITRDASVDGFEADPGRGVRGIMAGETYFLGNWRMFKEQNVPLDNVERDIGALEAAGETPVIVGTAKECLGVIAVSDTLKPESKQTIGELKRMGLRVAMVTGDTKGTATAIARTLGIGEFYHELLPEEKITVIETLHAERGSVMMIGDGINDSPAMAASDVGVAMGAAGTDVAMETGDIVLLADDLERIPELIRLSRRAVSIIRQNVIISLAIIAVLVPAALIGAVDLLPGLVINEGGAIAVILNGLRLLK